MRCGSVAFDASMIQRCMKLTRENLFIHPLMLSTIICIFWKENRYRSVHFKDLRRATACEVVGAINTRLCFFGHRFNGRIKEKRCFLLLSNEK